MYSCLVYQVPTVGDMIDQWKKNKNNAFGILYSWFLAKVLKFKVFHEIICSFRLFLYFSQ